MAINTLIMGESGSGKSSSIRTLDPAETYVINVIDKPLPFRGARKVYVCKEGGNYFATDNYGKILTIINKISQERPQVKNVIIDDFQYIMANEFMRRATERGFDKFSEIAQHAWEIPTVSATLRQDLNFFLLAHTEVTPEGKAKCKTIGRMMDNNITFEGMFTVILHALVNDGQYKFLTQHDGTHIAKSPMGMFETKLVENDLKFVKERMNKYLEEDFI